MTTDQKPETFEEALSMISNGDIELMLCDTIGDNLHMLICDHRRTYEQGEIYELVFPVADFARRAVGPHNSMLGFY